MTIIYLYIYLRNISGYFKASVIFEKCLSRFTLDSFYTALFIVRRAGWCQIAVAVSNTALFFCVSVLVLPFKKSFVYAAV